MTFDASVPTAAITSPANGATVSSAVTVTASASDNAGVVAVQFKLDGANLGLEDTTSPFAVTWDTATASPGQHTLTAEARDAAGNRTTSAPVTVTVAQGTTGTIRIEDSNTAVGYAANWNQGDVNRPWSGGTAALGFALGDRAMLSFTGTGVSWIGFRGPWAGIANVFVDQTMVATVDAYAAAETLQAVLFTASGLASGPHTLTIEVTRTKNPSSVDYTVFVDAFDVMGSPADATPPTVTVASPSSGTTVSGTVPVTASADDNVGVAGVTFFVDGAPLGAETTIAPHSINWNTTTVMDGAHTLTAVARDASGNTGSSLSVTVTVNNAAGPVKATRFENVSPSITYTNGSAAPMRPATWYHGSRSAPWSGGTASFNRSAGARATFTFSGTLVRWIGFRASWAGIARVFIDGVSIGEVDLYSPTEQVQAAVFTATNLTAGSHTLAVEATGQKRGGDSCVAGDGDCASDYAVVVDAFDVAPGSAPPAAGTRFEETVPAMTYAGTWAPGDPSRAWSAGTAVSATAGAQATLTFTGTSASWIGLRGPATGIARVFLDGAFQAEVDTFSPVDIQAVVFSVTGLAAARHTLTIDVTGGRNAAATNSLIVVDAFDVRSRFEDEDPSVAYTSTWLHADTDGAWSGTSLDKGAGTAARSTAAGADATFTFTGTAVSWVGYRGPLAGIAEVFLDGAFVDRIDLYASADQPQVPVFTATGLAPGSHTLRILVTGERNPAATAARVVVDAFDVTLPSTLPMVTRTQDTNPSVTYTAPTDWNQGARFTAWSGETGAFSATAGARATFAFTGRSVRWVGQRGFGFGVARVFLDGVLVGEADTFTPFQEEFQSAIFSATGLPAGNHTLTIEVTGLKNPASGGTQIVVDAFDVY